MRISARPRLPDGDCVFISGVRIVARANAPFIAADMTWLGFDPRSSTHPCVYCLFGFETLKDLEFRNREGGYMRATISAPIRRSRGSSRRFCPSGTRFRRSSSPARGMNPIPGRACSCWTSRGGCSASRGSERHTGISRDRARRAVRARTGNAVAVWASVASDWPFAKRAYRARTKRSGQQRSPNLLANSWASNLRLLISPTSNEGLRPAVLQTA